MSLLLLRIFSTSDRENANGAIATKSKKLSLFCICKIRCQQIPPFTAKTPSVLLHLACRHFALYVGKMADSVEKNSEVI